MPFPFDPDLTEEPKLDFTAIKCNMGNFFRTKVPGGWLLMNEGDVMHYDVDYGRHGFRSGFDWRTALVFIPDPTHEWKVN